jgi:hypothetical protein
MTRPSRHIVCTCNGLRVWSARSARWIIYRLIAMFGRSRAWRDVPWLEGPLGGAVFGDAPYRDVAAKHGLSVERRRARQPAYLSLRSGRLKCAGS